MLIAFDFPDLRTDAAHAKNTLVVRLGTRASAFLHDGLIAAAFLIYGLWSWLAFAVPMTGIAFMAVGGWPVFLALPIAGWQIGRIHWQLSHPQASYQLFVTGAMALFAFMAMMWLVGLFLG